MENFDFQKMLNLALSHRTVELLGSGDTLSSFVAETLTQESSCVWIHASDARRDAFLNANISMTEECFAETSVELLGLAKRAFKKSPRRIIVSLPTSYDGTRFSLVMDLADLSEQYKGTQLLLLRDISDAHFATPAAVRISLNQEKALFGVIRTTSLIKLAGLTEPLTDRNWLFTCPAYGKERAARVPTYRTTRALLFN